MTASDKAANGWRFGC